MKNLTINKIALTMSLALAASCCMLTMTGCGSDEKASETTKEETTVEETTADEIAEETTTEETTTETTVEETVTETSDEVIIDESADESVELGMTGNMPSDFTNEAIVALAQKYADSDYMLMKIESDEITEEPEVAEHYVEGFVALGSEGSLSVHVDTENPDENSSSGSMQYATCYLFDDATVAADFLSKSFADFEEQGFGEPTITENEDGKVYELVTEFATVTATVTNDGVIELFEVISM